MGIGSSAARKLASLRRTYGGPSKKPTKCPKCDALCNGAREARAHCAGKRRLPRIFTL